MTMEIEVKKYETYKNDIRFMVSSFGGWPNYEKHPPILRKFLMIFSAAATGFTLYCIVAYCIHVTTNITTFTSSLGLMIGFIAMFIKLFILAMNQEELQSLNDGISASFESDLRDPENRPYLLANFRMFSRFMYMYNYSVRTSVGLLVIMPLVLLRHGKYVRMYPQIMPFTYEPGGTIHWLLYVFETIVGFYIWSITIGVESLFGLYSLHMVGQLRLLSARFQNLKCSKNYEKDIQDCMRIHRLLIKSLKKIQVIFGFLAIWVAVTCAIALCCIVFQASVLRNTTPIRLAYLIAHSIVKLGQAYSYCWYGNIITVESDACLSSIYNAHWPGSGDMRIMKDVLIILSQRPMVFKAMHLMEVRLDMFSKIANTTISYYFLLRTLVDKA